MGVPGEAMAAARRVLGDVFGFPPQARANHNNLSVPPYRRS